MKLRVGFKNTRMHLKKPECSLGNYSKFYDWKKKLNIEQTEIWKEKNPIHSSPKLSFLYLCLYNLNSVLNE